MRYIKYALILLAILVYLQTHRYYYQQVETDAFMKHDKLLNRWTLERISDDESKIDIVKLEKQIKNATFLFV